MAVRNAIEENNKQYPELAPQALMALHLSGWNPDNPIAAAITEANRAMLVQTGTDVTSCFSEMQGADFLPTLAPITANSQTSHHDLRNIVWQFSKALSETYPDPENTGKTVYPLGEAVGPITLEQVINGKLDLYAVVHNGEVVGGACTVRKPGAIDDGPLIKAEFGRVAFSQNKPKPTGARGLLKARVQHALGTDGVFNDPNMQFVYADMRVAEEWNHAFPGGRGIQSVLVGTAHRGNDLGLMPTNIGWRYKLGKTEPFVQLTRYPNPHEAAEILEGQSLYIPNADIAQTMVGLLNEHYHIEPQIETRRVNETTNPDNIPVVLDYSTNTHFAPIVGGIIHIASQISQNRTAANSLPLQKAFEVLTTHQSPNIECRIEVGGNTVNENLVTGAFDWAQRNGLVFSGYAPSDRTASHGELPLSLVFGKPQSGDLIPADLPASYYAHLPLTHSFLTETARQLTNQ